MRLVVFAVVVCTAQAQDVMHIVSEYSERQAFQDERAKDYTYNEHRTIRKLDRLGQTKSEETAVYEVLIVEGKRMWRLTERNGRPVTAKEASRRQREIARGARRPPVPFQQRYDKFQLEGEEEVNGRMAWVVTAEKKVTHPWVVTYSTATRKAKVWIDETEFACAKFQGDWLGDVIGVGGKANLGTDSLQEYMRVAEGVWLPMRTVTHAGLDAPVGLFPLSMASHIKEQFEIEVTYTDYKKFNADSRIVEMPVNPR